ncbi:RNA-binding protein 27 isoform X1 [Labrus mixtus]|uniref:RNA-binding protein 27 isoform X1 n=1 Tax=Labrus mixtus TaxID=508554 RepID=UPI0029BFC0FC|nr:RNA-binding protein 27 isoform X1 [Labrus mixtus]
MIIENVEALKSWLAKLLEPICDADPSALANYVVALVKKDKPEKELKALCADQLDVFLQKDTVGFVDKLFECLTTKNYLGNPPAKEPPKEEIKPPLTIKPEVVEAETPEEERENRRRRSPLRNRSDFNEPRSRDDRRRDERKRRDFDRHGKSANDSHRERERHERRRGSPRGRSYSRSRSRSRSRSGSRGKSRDREHRGGRDFKSKFESERKDTDCYNSSTTSGPPQQHPPPLLPLPTPPHPFSSSSSVGVPGAGGPPVATPAHLPDSTTDSWSGYYGTQRQDGVVKPFNNKVSSLKQRCRDYDEKGFCVRGDLCPFDHGNDPLIVDDVNLPNMIPFPPPPVMPPAGLPMPPITEPPPPLRMPSMPPPPYGQPPPPGVFPMTGPPLIVTSGIDTPNHQSAITSSPPIGPPGVGLPPTLPPPPPPPPPSSSSSVSLRPQYVQSEYNYDPEGYNPESPGLTTAGRNPYRQFIPRVQTQRSNLIGLTSNEGQGSRAANIVIQTEPATVASTPGSNVPRFNTEQDNRKRTMGPSTAEGPAVKKPWMEKPGFNNQHKSSFPKRYHYVNTKLEVRKIPRELNNITKLNEHFSKFGTIVNIQVVFGGDPEAALIQYTKNEEARRAISSIEAVLNNRFIRVYWHREPGTNATGPQQQEQSSGSQAAGTAPSQAPQHSNIHKGIKQHNPAAYVLNNTLPKHRLSAGPTAPTKQDSLNPNADAVTVAPTLTNAQKGPYSSTAHKSSSKSLGKTGKALEAQEVLKKKQEALKLQQDMRKQKQEMLKTQIECQKVLINRLEKNRGMKPEERANIMKTLKELTEKITQLQNEMNPASQVPSAKSNHNQPKTKIDAQKELLDAELDFHKKMISGEDTTDLKRKLGQLQVEATRLGLIRAPGGRGRGRGKMALEPGSMHVGRGRGRSRDMMARSGSVNRMVVDHRPRALAILGVTQEEKEELMPHFVKFGDIEDIRDQDANTVIMTFKTRSEAENAANQGAKFKGRVLQISWYKPKTPSVTTEPEEEESKDEDNTKEASSYLPGEEEEEEEEEDDDEDDEYESRSWRR